WWSSPPRWSWSRWTGPMRRRCRSCREPAPSFPLCRRGVNVRPNSVLQEIESGIRTLIPGVLAGAAAAGDWFAVARERKLLEYLCKPAVMAFLIWGALALRPDHPAQRGWFVAALALSLAGDVFLMLPR